MSLSVGGSVTALGVFDGVHIGHRALLGEARKRAAASGLEFSVFTFSSDKKFFKSKSPLYRAEDKLGLLESLGAENVIIADFEDISEVSAEDFIKKCLIGDIKTKCAAVGRDFRFGFARGGDAELLRRSLDECIVCEDVCLDGEKVSSTRIRSLLLSGDAERAARLLGIPYFVLGEARHGRGVGREMGFPTVNIPFDEFTPPLKKGVYRTVSVIENKLYNSVTNVGICPTFGLDAPHIETHLIDFSGDLYGERVRTHFLEYLRDEVRFNTQKELIMQINVDKNTTIKKNGEMKWQEIGLSLP